MPYVTFCADESELNSLLWAASEESEYQPSVQTALTSR